jgi:hypothetical protein
MGFEEVSQTEKEGDERALLLTGGSVNAVLWEFAGHPLSHESTRDVNTLSAKAERVAAQRRGEVAVALRNFVGLPLWDESTRDVYTLSRLRERVAPSGAG